MTTSSSTDSSTGGVMAATPDRDAVLRVSRPPSVDPATPTPAPAVRPSRGGCLRAPWRWEEGQVRFAALAGAALVLALTYHPYWVRGLDQEVYLGMARHLVRGEGLRFNGNPAGLVPPLWPMLLAAMMWLTPVYGVVKLVMPVLMWIHLACAWFVLRRQFGVWTTAGAVGLVAILQPTLLMAHLAYAEAALLACNWGALLLAMQARERFDRSSPAGGWGFAWRLGAAALLLAAGVGMKWTGLLWFPVVALALVEKRRFARLLPGGRTARVAVLPRRLDAAWVGVFIVCVVTVAAFVGVRYSIRIDPADLDPRYNQFVAGNYSLVNPEGRPTVWTHVERLVNGPQWLSVLYWNLPARTPPFRYWAWWLAATTVPALAAAGVRGLLMRRWVWVGVGLAWIPVMVTWPDAIDRYSMPVAPFLIAGTIWGFAAAVAGCSRRGVAGRLSAGVVLIVAGTAGAVAVGYNGTMLAWEVVVARGDTPALYEAGQNRSLARLATHVRVNDPYRHDWNAASGGEVVVSSVFENLGRRRWSMNNMRQAGWVLDRPVIDAPTRISGEPTDLLLGWAYNRGARWYLYQPAHHRFMHVPYRPWVIPEWRDGTIDTLPPFGDPRGEWRLLEIRDGIGWKVSGAAADERVLVVPGLEDASRVGVLGGLRRRLPVPYP